MSPAKREKRVYVPPPDTHCFICVKPKTDPPGWHCQDRHTTEYVYPWLQKEKDERDNA